MRLALGLALALSILGVDAAGCSQKSDSGLPLIPLAVDGHKIRVEVASTPASHSRGLMYRRELKANRGMLFVYQEPQRLSFWMKNTFVPLTVAFLDDEGHILQMEDMQPQTTTSHKSRTPVRYALEMPQGWFAQRGLGVGSKAEFQWEQSEP